MPFGLLLVGTLATASIVDARSMRLPNVLSILLAFGGLAHMAVIGTPSLLDGLMGACLGALTFGSVAVGFRQLRGLDGLGLGDVKLFAAAGLWIGWQGLAPALLVASLSALLFVGLRAIAEGRFDRRRPIPFGPFLSLGILVSWLFPVA